MERAEYKNGLNEKADELHGARKVCADQRVEIKSLEQQVAQLREAHRDLGVHLSHCNFGEHENVCKYGKEAACPALTPSWEWFGKALSRAEKLRTAHTTLRGLVEKLPVAGLPVEHSRSNDFIVLKAGEGWLAHTYNYWAKFATEDEAKAYVALLQYRATLPREGGAQEVGNAL